MSGPKMAFYREVLKKDMKRYYVPVFKLYLIHLILVFIMVVGFTLYVQTDDPTPTETYDPDETTVPYDNWEEVETEEEKNEFDRQSNFGITPEVSGVSMLTFMVLWMFGTVLFLFHGLAYTSERITGTMRTLTHYKVSMREVLIAKTVSVVTMTTLMNMKVCLAFAAMTLIYGHLYDTSLPMFLLVVLYGIVVSLFLALMYVTFMALTAIIMALRVKTIANDPLIYMVLALIISVVSSETVLIMGHNMLRDMQDKTFYRPWFASISIMSPLHSLGRLMYFISHGEVSGFHGFIWIPFCLAMIIIGFIVAKKIYPDLLIKETA